MVMDVMTTSTIGMMTHSTGIMAGAMVGHGDHGVVGMAHSGDGILHMHGIIGAGEAVGATTAMVTEATGAVKTQSHAHRVFSAMTVSLQTDLVVHVPFVQVHSQDLMAHVL